MASAEISAAFSVPGVLKDLAGPTAQVFGGITIQEVNDIAATAGRGQMLNQRDRQRIGYLRDVVKQDSTGAVPIRERILVDEVVQLQVAKRQGVEGYVDAVRRAEELMKAKDMTLESMCAELGRGAAPYVAGLPGPNTLTDAQFQVTIPTSSSDPPI